MAVRCPVGARRKANLHLKALRSLAPISQAIAGVISKWDLTLMFALSGVLVLLVTLWMAFSPAFRSFTESLTTSHAEG